MQNRLIYEYPDKPIQQYYFLPLTLFIISYYYFLIQVYVVEIVMPKTIHNSQDILTIEYRYPAIYVQNQMLIYQIIGAVEIVFTTIFMRFVEKVNKIRHNLHGRHKFDATKLDRVLIIPSISQDINKLYFFDLGAYSRLEGTWSSRRGGVQVHDTLLEAKRWCSQTGNCFGIFIRTVDPTGAFLSMEFPVLLSHGTDNFIYKKEQILGIILSISFWYLYANNI